MANSIVNAEKIIISKIHLIRGQKVMIDLDLSELYGVKRRVLNLTVRRNEECFPEDFMFELTEGEFKRLKSQNRIPGLGRVRKLPLAFTVQGVWMLSNVLKRETPKKVDIPMIRIFTRRRGASSMRKVLLKLDQIEKLMSKQNQLPTLPQEPRPRIGFRRADEKD